MTKKLLMNNSINEDVVILCRGFSPNRQPFVLWENQKIDWDKYELYINVDITNITKEWQHILTVSASDIDKWAGVGKFHIYGSLSRIRTQVVNGNSGNPNFNIDTYTNQKEVEIIFNKDGAYVNGVKTLKPSNNSVVLAVINLLRNNQITIGSSINTDLPVCVYNVVKLQPYQERG